MYKQRVFWCLVILIAVLILIFGQCRRCRAGEIDLSIRQNFDFTANQEIDSAEPYYEVRVGYGPLYLFIQDEKEGRLRWGGQHGGPITSQGAGVGLRYKIERDRLSFNPWCQIGIYNIDIELADRYPRKPAHNSHWEALMLKQNKIVGYDYCWKTYQMDIKSKNPIYGTSLGFDIDYRIWKKLSLFMAGGYTWTNVRYHIWGYNGPKLDKTKRHWSVEETLNLDSMTGSIGFRITF